MCAIRLSAVAVLVVVLRAQTPDDRFRFVLTGDSIIGRRLSVYDEPPYLQMFEEIRSADATFTNFEMLVHNFDAGFKRFENAVVTISGIELAEKIKQEGPIQDRQARRSQGEHVRTVERGTRSLNSSRACKVQGPTNFIPYLNLHQSRSGHLYAECRSVRKQVTPELCPTIF